MFYLQLDSKKIINFLIKFKKKIYICEKGFRFFAPLSGTKESPVKPIKSLKWASCQKVGHHGDDYET